MIARAVRIGLSALALIASLSACHPMQARPPASATSSVSVVVEATNKHTEAILGANHATIVIDAIDNKGGHGQYPDGVVFRPYPLDKRIELPYTHTIYYEPGLIINVAVTVTYVGNDGDIISCHFEQGGAEIDTTRQVAQVKVIGQMPDGAARIYCFYAAG